LLIVLIGILVSSKGMQELVTVRGGVSMPKSYRAYEIDENGKIWRAPHVVQAETDDDAIRQTKSVLNADDIEIWEGARMVARLPRS
jgi:hypothetical protein